MTKKHQIINLEISFNQIGQFSGTLPSTHLDIDIWYLEWGQYDKHDMFIYIAF